MSTALARTPRTLLIGNTAIQVEELAERLPFARKPADLSEVHGKEYATVYVTETRQLTAAEFDAFTCSLLMSRDWLRGKGGGTRNGYLCIEVAAPGRPTLYVNPEGGDYARYVARAD
ncbi:MFS transporter [Ralstonia solanacearum]|nr:MFS transporter [Ralstonia solanacearum]